MKKFTIVFLLNIICYISYGQITDPLQSTEDSNKVFTNSATPAFKGGYKAWLQFLHCCLDTSVLVKDKVAGNTYKVQVRLIVDRHGKVSDVNTVNVPEDCPDCGIEAVKLFYKNNESNSTNNCNPKVYNEPYKHWLPAILETRPAEVSAMLILNIPFGYYDDPDNKRIFDKAQLYRDNFDKKTSKDKSQQAQQSIEKRNDNSDEADDDDEQEGNVIKQNGHYILTLLKDNSKHVVFRPLMRNSDTAMINKYNAEIGLNQALWGEITTDKNGKQTVTFYTFSGTDSDVEIQNIPTDTFKKTFYNPK